MVFFILVFIVLACATEDPNQGARLDDKLFESIRQGNVERADSCLRAGARLEARNTEGATPLIVAANAGSIPIATRLLEAGADVQARREGYYGSTALMEVAAVGDTVMAHLLLEHGADVHRRDTFGDPAINWAAYYGNIGITRLLLERGARWDVASRHGTALDIAAKQWNLPLLEFFISRGAGQPIGDEGARRFLEAVRAGSLDGARRYLEGGGRAGRIDELGTPALVWAAARGHEELVHLLLQYGAEPDAANRTGQTALAAAARFGHEEIVRLLLAAGAGPDAAGRQYQITPLISAAMGGRPGCARILLDAGANPDKTDAIDGFTPLMYAITYNHPKMVELLIEYRANPYIKSKDGTGIYELISFSANPEIARMIEDYVLKRQ